MEQPENELNDADFFVSVSFLFFMEDSPTASIYSCLVQCAEMCCDSSDECKHCTDIGLSQWSLLALHGRQCEVPAVCILRMLISRNPDLDSRWHSLSVPSVTRYWCLCLVCRFCIMLVGFYWMLELVANNLPGLSHVILHNGTVKRDEI